MAGFAQALPECVHLAHEQLSRCSTEETDHRHRGLLPTHSHWPRRRAADQRDELAAFH
jgi:hypothetical protein